MAGFPKPLEGRKIVDLSLLLPGPYATMMLRGFGAEVIKVEPPEGDPVLRMSPDLHRILNRGKRIERLDLKSPEGRDRLSALMAGADAVVEGFRPGVFARLGFDPAELRVAHERLVVASISGYGATGPYRDHPAHDMGVLGVAGYYSLPSQLEDSIVRPNIRLADVLCAQAAALAILAAMTDAARTGSGCIVDTSLFDATAAPVLLSLLARSDPEAPPERQGLVMADSAPYECACGGHVCIATLEDKHWANFVQAATDPGDPLRDRRLATRPGRDADKPGLAALLAALFRSRSRAEWIELAHAHALSVTPVWRGGEVLSDPQVEARGLIGRDAADATLTAPTFPAAFDGEREPY